MVVLAYFLHGIKAGGASILIYFQPPAQADGARANTELFFAATHLSIIYQKRTLLPPLIVLAMLLLTMQSPVYCHDDSTTSN